MHVVTRIRAESLLAVVQREATPVLSRVANLPVHPGARLHVAQVSQNHARHPERNVLVAALVKRARFGLPHLLVFRERRVEQLRAGITAGIAVRVHLEHVRKRFGTVLVELVQGIANVRLVGGTHRSLREQALLLERLAEFHNHLRLVVLEPATFLSTVRLPPAGTRFVERFHRAERNSPFLLEMQRHFGEVVREVVEIVFLEVVAAVARARNAATLGHPPRGRIAERLENRALHALGKFNRNRTLVRVCRPVKIALFRGLVAGNVRAAVALR